MKHLKKNQNYDKEWDVHSGVQFHECNEFFYFDLIFNASYIRSRTQPDIKTQARDASLFLLNVLNTQSLHSSQFFKASLVSSFSVIGWRPTKGFRDSYRQWTCAQRHCPYIEACDCLSKIIWYTQNPSYYKIIL